MQSTVTTGSCECTDYTGLFSIAWSSVISCYPFLFAIIGATPFTTEQVEEVKAFFGILKVLMSLGPFFIVDFAATESLSILGRHMALITVSLICSFTMNTAGHIGNPNVPCLFAPMSFNFTMGSFVIETLDISPYLLLIQNILTAAAYILI